MERLGSEGRATFKGGPGCLRGQRLRCSNFNPSFRTKIRKCPIVLSVSLFSQGILGQKLGNATCSSVEVGEVQFNIFQPMIIAKLYRLWRWSGLFLHAFNVWKSSLQCLQQARWDAFHLTRAEVKESQRWLCANVFACVAICPKSAAYLYRFWLCSYWCLTISTLPFAINHTIPNHDQKTSKLTVHPNNFGVIYKLI